MKKLSRKSVLGATAALTLGLGVGLATNAVADIPDSTSGEITGCYTTSGGQVRVIDKEASAACHSYETEFSFPSEGGTSYTPKERITNLLTTGSSMLPSQPEVTCPTGEKFVDGFAVTKYKPSRPHLDDNWWDDEDISGTLQPTKFVKDSEGTLTGARFNWPGGNSDLMVVLVCSV